MAGILETIKATAETIKVSAEAIKAVADALDEFARSVVIEVNNTSTRMLVFNAEHHDHGGFKEPPPGAILPFSSAVFSSHSSGLAVGTEGKVEYRPSTIKGPSSIWIG
ncbi:MAG: hypothetical protein H0U97_15365 [Gammaproteobacteria bacterium]|nr:hypothetical protein [Gammaproteobacteria bacterium]